MSTFLIPSPSLPHPRSLKIAALLNRLSLSFICHSPHHAPHSPALSVFYLFSLLPPPSLPPQRTHRTGFACVNALLSSHFCTYFSAPSIACRIRLCAGNQRQQRERGKERLLVSLLYMFAALFALPHLPLCSLSTSLPPYVLPPSLSLSPCSLHLFQTQGSYI